MRKNPTEAIVDKDNHLRDALKYILLSLFSSSEVPKRLQRDDMIAEAIANGRQATLAVLMARYDAKRRAECEPVSYRALSSLPRKPDTEGLVRPRTTEDRKNMLAETMAGIHARRLDPKIGSVLGYLGTALLKAMEATDLEKRIATLEQHGPEKSG